MKFKDTKKGQVRVCEIIKEDTVLGEEAHGL